MSLVKNIETLNRVQVSTGRTWNYRLLYTRNFRGRCQWVLETTTEYFRELDSEFLNHIPRSIDLQETIDAWNNAECTLTYDEDIGWRILSVNGIRYDNITEFSHDDEIIDALYYDRITGKRIDEHVNGLIR